MIKIEKNIKNIVKDIGSLKRIKNLLFSSKKKGFIVLIILMLFVFFGWRNFIATKQAAQYQTAIVEKGTLVVSLTEAGQVAVSNKVSIVTQASGIVSKIYVKSGDTVKAGDKIADITLDTAGQQRQAQAWSSLISAQNSLDSANARLFSLQSAMYSAWKTYMDIAQNSTYQNPDGSANNSNRVLTPFTIAQNDWFAAEAAYKNQSGIIAAAGANLNNANLAYQLTSGTITAPTAGVIGDLTITEGMQIGSSNTTAGSSTNTSNQTIASIKTGSSATVLVNVAEVDAPKVQVGQKATISFDAFLGKTFTGKVMGINTTGAVSSGVTTYPAVIQLDNSDNSILPNMSATANIITIVDDNVLLVPSSAVQTIGTQSTVRVLKNGAISTVNVEVGNSSDSQTEIISGLLEGDVVVTSAISMETSQTSGSSPFSGGLRLGGFGGSSTGVRGGTQGR
ncbi:MAG: HlyD family efflux transporter periplasmic adaptor subunit [Candidatus Levyibacteriota bacterium]